MFLLVHLPCQMKTYLSVIINLFFCSSIAAQSSSGIVFRVEPAHPLEDNYNAVFKLGNARLLSNLVVFYNHLASKSVKKGSLAEAEETLLKKSIPLSIRYGNAQTNYNCFMALAKCYVGQKKYTPAKWYYIQSNIAAQKAKYPKGEVLSLIQLANLKKTIGDDSLALADFKAAEKIAVAIKLKTALPGIRKSIAALPQKEKNTKKSLEVSEKKVAATTGSANQ